MHKHTIFLSIMLLTVVATTYTADKAPNQDRAESAEQSRRECCRTIAVSGCGMLAYVSAILIKACYNTPSEYKEE